MSKNDPKLKQMRRVGNAFLPTGKVIGFNPEWAQKVCPPYLADYYRPILLFTDDIRNEKSCVYQDNIMSQEFPVAIWLIV